MSKLFKLKEWLSIPDAAAHLALVFGEPVTEADVFRFALNGSLTISANFINGGTARFGKLIPISEAEFEELPSFNDGPPVRFYGGPTFLNGNEDETHVLPLAKAIVSLRGVYDLPMLGGERHDLEHRFQALTGGPSVEIFSVDGAFIKAADGSIGQLQEDMENHPYEADSRASLASLESRIAAGMFAIDIAEDLLEKHKKNRVEFLNRRKAKPPHERYYPAGGLPNDCALVIRTRALTDFIALANEDEMQGSKPQSTRERDSLLKLILGMALGGYGFDPKASKSPTPKEIADDLAAHGISMTDDTVRKYLQKAARAHLLLQK